MSARTPCKLCLRPSVLCASHIIPEFLFKPAYNTRHQAVQLRSDTSKRRIVQKGLRDQLLCTGCEQLINERYEKPFQRMWYVSPGVPTIVPDQLVEIAGLDYAAFKLFHLSVLWRASVAAIPAFAQVSLGPKHGEQLRRMLLSGDAGSRSQYGIMGALLTHPGSLDVCYGLVVGPDQGRYEGHRAYNMVYGGAAWYVFVSGHAQPALLQQTLTTTGTLRLTYRELTKHPPLQAIAASRRLPPSQ